MSSITWKDYCREFLTKAEAYDREVTELGLLRHEVSHHSRMLARAIFDFNRAAEGLQQTGYSRARTPKEWQELKKIRHKREHGPLISTTLALLLHYRTAEPAERVSATNLLTPEALYILQSFASITAVLSVRQDKGDLVRQGLTAVALLGDRADIRELTITIATLFNAASRLCLDTDELFFEASTLTTSDALRDVLAKFPSRRPPDRDLKAFKLYETETDGEYDIDDVIP